MRLAASLLAVLLLAGCAGTGPGGPAGDAARAGDDAGPAPRTLESVMRARLEAAFEDRACDPPRGHAPDRYAGPMYDMHVHMPILHDAFPEEDDTPRDARQAYVGVDATVDDVVCNFRHEGTARALVFFQVFPRVARVHTDLAARAVERYPEEIAPSISPPDASRPSADGADLERFLQFHPGVFRGYGEIGLYPTPDNPAGTSPDGELLAGIYPVLRERGMFSYLHLGPAHREAFERAAAANPDLTFVFHGDNLVTYDGDRQNLSAIEGILERHPNVVYGVDELYGDEWLLRRGVTKAEFLHHFRDYEPLLAEDLDRWRPLIERHPDQVVWGTDRGADVWWSLDPLVGWTLNDYARAFIARLEPAVQEKLAWRNAERVLGP